MTSKVETVSNLISEISTQFNPYDMELNKTVAIDINNQIDNYTNGIQPTELEIAQTVIAMNGSLLIRDFVLGLPADKGLDAVSSWLSYVSDNSPAETHAPIATIKSAYCYETGDLAGANFYLSKAFEVDITYSLATLLKRTFEAAKDMPGLVNLVEMRNELHPKVKEELGLN